MASTRPPFRRRQFFIKQGFQTRFAVYPVVFLAAFLVGAGAYLHWELTGLLELELYLPHSRLQNPWDEVAPLLTRVVLWGGGAFLTALAAWVWRRFGTLHRDLDRLADWLAAHARGQGPGELPAFGDGEVAALGAGLEEAMAGLQRWDGRVRTQAAEVASAAGRLGDPPQGDRRALAGSLADVRAAVEALGQVVAEVSVDEGLS